MNINNLFLCPICNGIPENEREYFLEQLNYKIRVYGKGDFVARQDDPVEALYLLLSGSVKTEMISDAGTVLNIETIKAPCPLAPAFLFAENNRFPVDVIVKEDSEVLLIPKNTVMSLLASNESFLKGYMAFNSNRTTFLSERIRLLSIKTIKGKLAQYMLSRTQNNHFTFEMSQTQLAEYFGVARPSLARSLSEMVDDGIITLKRREGEILDMNALKELMLS